MKRLVSARLRPGVRRFVTPHLVAAPFVLAALPLGAAAQPANTQQTGGDASDFDTINVTATKTEEKTIDTMAGASVVTRTDMQRFQPSSIADMLQNVPGVSSQQSANDPGQSINIRGVQDFGRVNVLVDGARQDYQISGHNANGTFYLEPAFLAQADITRGPVTNIYGSGAIGGVVAFRTLGINDILKPDEKYGVLQTIGAGTNGQNLLTSTAGGVRIGSTADLFGQFVYRNRSSYSDGAGNIVPDTGSDLVGGLAKLNVRPADGQEISATALTQNYQFANQGTSGDGPRFNNDVTAGTYTLGYRFNRPDAPLFDLSVKTYYTETKNIQTLLAPDATYAALGAVAGAKATDQIGTFGFDVVNTARFSLANTDHAVSVGGDGAWDHVTTTDAAGGFISALTPSGNRALTGAFIQDEVRYGGWLRVLGGVRYDNYQLNGGPYSSGGDHISPKITVGVTPFNGVEFYATYAQSYRAPTITETLISGTHPFPAFNILPNPYLMPETAYDVEGGVNLKYDDILRAGDKFRAKIDAFDNKISNYIDMEAVGPAYLVSFIPGMPSSVCSRAPYLCFPIQSYQYLNVARAEISGLEAEAAYDWHEGFASFSGTLIHGDNVTTGEPLNTVFPSRFSVTGGWRFLDQTLTAGARFTVVAASASGVTTPTASYGLVDLFANYAYNDQISSALTITNLFNRNYIQYLDSEPSPGLTAKLSVSVKFAAK
ncbi:TonB-dependent hemoglobin/transferrin/lactoferrin family receptor [Rhodoblastus sp.]|uniref:TonB-dependent hemoglobin/transferrin/lactoferrin family receptor n=1 Tax=Rhodoblastus sp. TaxID=1962975 RepID=UPI0035AF4087